MQKGLSVISMKRIAKIFVFILIIVACRSVSMAQEKYEITSDDYDNQEVEMADVMRQNGKIYVVVGVIFIIFAGMTYYMYSLDKKISRIEKEIKQ